jgi:ABC-type transporter Mla maintaining outer membrane lipid asymmetry permease subunit MlaE
VGRACTEAFVASCMVILAVDFFLNVVFNAVYNALYGFKPLL